MSTALPLLVAVPVLTAAVSMALRGSLRVQRVLTFLVVGGLLVAGGALTAATSGGDVLVERVGGWPAPFAITFAVDTFSALMLTVTTLTALVSLWFAAVTHQDDHPYFHPLALVLSAGVANALVTADLFNLFVAFEVMLIASYVMLVLGAGREHVRAGAVYVTTSLLASALFVVGVGLTYGVVGTVNLAELSEVDPSLLTVPGAVLLVAFGVKAALVPVHGWLPRSYVVPPPAVAALFSGLLTKVGIYAIYRVYSVAFGELPGFRNAALVAAGVSMLVAVLAAFGRDHLREILAFHMTSQIGYMVMGVGLFGEAGLAAGVFFILHHIIVKASLFLSAGAVTEVDGSEWLSDLGGMARRRPELAVAFGLAALSLAGLPPLSGFVGKLLLTEAAFGGARYLIAAVGIFVSFYTLASMGKIWIATFWGEPVVRPAVAGGSGDEAPPLGGHRTVGRWSLAAPALVLAIVSLGLGIGAEGLHRLAHTAATNLADNTAYVDAVLGR